MKKGHRLKSTDIETIAKGFNDNIGLIDCRLDRMERILKWLLWKHTAGEDVKRLEAVIGMNPDNPKLEEEKKESFVRILDSAPDIMDILNEMAKEKKDEQAGKNPQKD